MPWREKKGGERGVGAVGGGEGGRVSDTIARWRKFCKITQGAATNIVRPRNFGGRTINRDRTGGVRKTFCYNYYLLVFQGQLGR